MSPSDTSQNKMPSAGCANGHLKAPANNITGIALALISMFCFALMDAVSKALAKSLAIPQILWFRYLVFAAMAIAVLRATGSRPLREAMKSRQPWLQAFRALLIVVENGVFVLAFTYLPLADVHAVAAVSPLLVIALSVPLLGERVGLRRWLAVAAGFAGVLLIVRPGFQVIGRGMAIALFAAALWGFYQVLVRKCSETDSSETTWLWTALVGLAATSIIGPLQWVAPDAAGWSMLVAIAILGSAAHVTLIKALSLAEASALQPFSYTLFLWTIPIGFVAFGDFPDRWTLAGAAIILVSGLYAWHRERVRASAA